jgi:hypothetical protein
MDPADLERPPMMLPGRAERIARSIPTTRRGGPGANVLPPFQGVVACLAMKGAASLEPVSWSRMIRAVEKVRERLLRVASALDRAGVLYAVAGGNAVAAWVSRVDEAAVRNTRDVDILLRRADLPAARTALEAAGFVYRHVSSLGRPGGLHLFLDGPRASARDAVHVVFAAEKVYPESPAASPDVSESEPADQFRLVTLVRPGPDETCRVSR